MSAADNKETPGQEPQELLDRRSALRNFSLVGLAAVAAPAAAAPKDPVTDLLNSLLGGGGSEPAPSEPAPTPAPKPPTEVKSVEPKGKYVKASKEPMGSVEDIPVNSGVLYEAEQYVIAQPKAGHFVGYDALCTHEGCPVDSFGTPGQMNCSCHGAKFNLATGKVEDGPAKKPLPKKPIVIENGKIYKAKKAK
ncbi:Rieske (2Fe-2S) protein [Sporichthya polymorpha]|uniref:Rieske (2Fe-2S) protein n=1 Tax=Sporichthya polymorpha TaxID=35751 RepID=UPI000376D412|nr:Rieske (2Fe-2S) protein [Sporichthya polymorpha]